MENKLIPTVYCLIELKIALSGLSRNLYSKVILTQM